MKETIHDQRYQERGKYNSANMDLNFPRASTFIKQTQPSHASRPMTSSELTAGGEVMTSPAAGLGKKGSKHTPCHYLVEAQGH